MSNETQEMVESDVLSGEDTNDVSNSGSTREIPIDSESDNSQEVNLEGVEEDNRSREELLKEVQLLREKADKTEEGRRKLQSRSDFLHEQLTKNAREAARLGLEVDDTGRPIGVATKQESKSQEDDESKIYKVIDERLRQEKRENLHSQIIKDVKELYPDLNDNSSALYQAAEQIINENPNLDNVETLMIVAELAETRLLRSSSPEIQRHLNELSKRKAAQSDSFVTASSTTSDDSGDIEGLTEEQRSYYKKRRGRNAEEMKRLEKTMRKAKQQGGFVING